MIRFSRKRGRRLAPGEMFPAGDAAYRVSYARLQSGTMIRVVERGDPAAPPVLFVPGWGCSVYAFRKTMPAVDRAGFRVVAIDLKGHGLSDKPIAPDDYTIDALVEHLRDVIDSLGLVSPALVGHSMGGSLAYHFAARYPDRVRSLVLLSAVGLTGVPPMPIYQALTPRVLNPLLRRFKPRLFVKIALYRVYGRLGRATESDVDEYWAPLQFPESGVALRELLHAYDWHAAKRRELRKVRLPAIGIWGSRDHLMPADGMAIYARLVPGIELHRIPDAGHVAPEEAPELVNPLVVRFLRANSDWVGRERKSTSNDTDARGQKRS